MIERTIPRFYGVLPNASLPAEIVPPFVVETLSHVENPHKVPNVSLESKKKVVTALVHIGQGGNWFVRSIPYRPDPHFKGRADLLREMRRQLCDPTRLQARMVLVGEPGMGKRSLAVEYVYKHWWDYSLAWWFDASQPATIPDKVAQICAVMDIDTGIGFDAPAAIRAVSRRVQERVGAPGRSLLVFNGVARMADLDAVVPADFDGHLLVISRHLTSDLTWDTMEVPALTIDAAVAFLQVKGVCTDTSEAIALAEALGRRPAYLKHAVTYISNNATTCGRYLKVLTAGHVSPGDAMWRAAVERVLSESPTASTVMNILAFFETSPIPRDTLENCIAAVEGIDWPAPVPSADYDAAIGVLRQEGIVDAGPDIVSMHRFVRKEVLASMTSDAQQRWSRIALSVANHAIDLGFGSIRQSTVQSPTWHTRVQMLPHALEALSWAERLGTSSPAAAFHIRLAAAIARDMEGSFEEARQVCVQLIATPDQIPGDLVDRACIQMSAILEHQRDLEAALAALDPVFAKYASEPYPETFWWALYHRGLLLINQDNLECANKTLVRVFNESHLDRFRVSAQHQLARIDIKLGSLDEAERKLQWCLAEREKDPGHRIAYEYRRLAEIAILRGPGHETTAFQHYSQAYHVANKYNFARYMSIVCNECKEHGLPAPTADPQDDSKPATVP